MTVELLQKIKAAAKKRLQFLVIDQHMPISARALAALISFGKITIVVENSMELSKVKSLFMKNPDVTVCLGSQLPLHEYDVIIGYALDNFMKNTVSYFKPSYILTFQAPPESFRFEGYYEIERGCYHQDSGQVAQPKLAEDEKKTDTTQQLSKEKVTEAINSVDENSPKNYEAYVESATSSKEKTRADAEPRWLFEQVKGRTTILLTLTGKMGNAAGIIKAVRDQKIPDVEFVVIDNCSKFKHNTKVTARFAAKVPEDYAELRGLEMSTGEYIMKFNQDSEIPTDIAGRIQRGEYDTRG